MHSYYARYGPREAGTGYVGKWQAAIGLWPRDDQQYFAPGQLVVGAVSCRRSQFGSRPRA